MKVEKWHQELDRFLDIKTIFMLEGNIYDLHAYPTQTPDGVRWDMVQLDNYLYKYLKGRAYDIIVFYNHIDGFYNPYDKDAVRQFADMVQWRIGANAGEASNPGMSQSADYIRVAMGNSENTVAVIMMLASRYVISSDNMSENERDFYTKMMLASLKKSQVRKNDRFITNSCFLLCEKTNDIPVWFYLDNPFVKSLVVQKPDKNTRRQFIDAQVAYFPGADSIETDDLEKQKEDFVLLTEGFQNVEINALKQLCKNESISLDHIADAINLYKYGIKENPWNEIPKERIDNAEGFIRERIKGQNHAITQALDVIKRAVSNLSGIQHSGKGKPKGILFFAGPTGTGKTELAKTMANLLFGDDDACIRFDMSEYQQSHSDQKLLGAPPGYVGYESGGQLTRAIKEKPFSIILFDEIEKAHPSIFDKFLQILEDGRMTDGKGETVYFSECIIIFTSNLGIYETDDFGHKTLNVSPDMEYEEMSSRIINSINNYFKQQLGRPELLNRIGENFVIFDFIREETAQEILGKHLQKIAENIKETKGITIQYSLETVEYLKKRSFGNLENGGRGIGNMIEKYLINPLARYLYDNHHDKEEIITVQEIMEMDKTVILRCK